VTIALQAGDASASPRDEVSIAAVVRSVIAEQLHRPAADIPLDAKLENQLEIDSLAMIEINVSLEERFGIPMPDLAVDHGVETVRELARFIASRLPDGPR
jgi:acyl carrier protein